MVVLDFVAVANVKFPIICSTAVAIDLPLVKYSFFFIKFTFWFFKVHKKEKLSIISDGLELVNAWFIIILLTDILTIVGSVVKIYIDMKNLKVCRSSIADHVTLYRNL